MTREEMRRRALRLLDDETSAPVFWSTDEMDQLIQEAQEVYAEEVEALVQTVYLPIRPGKNFYQLRGLGLRCMTPLRLWTRGRQHKLWPISMQEMTGHYERWLTVQGDPEWWGLHSWDTIFVWPAPTTGGGVFEVDCAVWPEPLLDDADMPAYPDPDHVALVQYVEISGRVKQWDIEAALERAKEWFGMAKDGQARTGVRAIQERFFARDGQRGQH